MGDAKHQSVNKGLTMQLHFFLRWATLQQTLALTFSLSIQERGSCNGDVKQTQRDERDQKNTQKKITLNTQTHKEIQNKLRENDLKYTNGDAQN